MSDLSLLQHYMRALGISGADAHRRLLFECIPGWKRGFVWLHLRIRPRLYASDWRLVREAGMATSKQEVRNAIDRWQHRAAQVRAWERETFGWRVSGRRLMLVARKAFRTRNEPVDRPASQPVIQTLRPQLEMAQTGIPAGAREFGRGPSSRGVTELIQQHE